MDWIGEELQFGSRARPIGGRFAHCGRHAHARYLPKAAIKVGSEAATRPIAADLQSAHYRRPIKPTRMFATGERRATTPVDTIRFQLTFAAVPIANFKYVETHVLHFLQKPIVFLEKR